MDLVTPLSYLMVTGGGTGGNRHGWALWRRIYKNCWFLTQDTDYAVTIGAGGGAGSKFL